MQVRAGRGHARERLLTAAARLLTEGGASEVSTRAICDAAGVQAPTLYHYFGSKQGLLDAVVSHGFDQYLARKKSHGTIGDPIEDIRVGWDDHVAFGLDNPAFYALMWGSDAVLRRQATPSASCSACSPRRPTRAAWSSTRPTPRPSTCPRSSG